jgi:hypothetical protein
MLRLTVLISGILSFVYFLRPDVFPTRRSFENTFGITQISQLANAEIVRQALLIHCLNNQKLPQNLNQLYNNELSDDRFVDLESLYEFTNEGNCNFKLTAK